MIVVFSAVAAGTTARYRGYDAVARHAAQAAVTMVADVEKPV